MAEKLILVDLNLNGNQLKKAAVQNESAAPSNPVAGQLYFNTTDHKFYYYNGTSWVGTSDFSSLDYADSGYVDGQFVEKVTEEDGVISVYRKAVSAGVVTFSSEKAVFTSKTTVLAAAEALADAITNGDITCETETPSSGAILKKYIFKKGGSNLVTIDIPKDLVVTGGQILTGTWSGTTFTPDDPQPGTSSGRALALTIANQTNPVYINVADLCDIYTAGNGIDVSSSNVISVKLDSAGETSTYLSLSGNGLKLDGIASAISTAISNISEVTKTASGTAAYGGTFVVNSVTTESGSVKSVGSVEVENAGAAAQAKADVIGDASTDTAASATIAGAKKYTDAAKAAIDAYTVNSVAISSNPVISAALATTLMSAQSSGVEIATDHPETIRVYYSGEEVTAKISWNATTSKWKIEWNGSGISCDIRYLNAAVTVSAAAAQA